MRILLLSAFTLWACTPTTDPEPLPADEISGEEAELQEDLGATSPARLDETLRQRLADDPDAPAEPVEPTEQDEGDPQPEDAQPEGQPQPTGAKPTQATMAPSPAAKLPPPCEGLSGAVAKAAAGDTSGLELDAQGRVHVSMSFGGAPPTLPAGCESELTAMGHIQAWCLTDALCALAVTEGISNIRPVRRADPKPD
jgi:hypothetical protein